MVVTGSVDKTVRGWDVRAGPGSPPLFTLVGHTYAVRRVRCSPHVGTEVSRRGVGAARRTLRAREQVATCSYDFTTRVWDFMQPAARQQVRLFADHSEFVIGLDWSLHHPGQLADVGWDQALVVRDVHA